jgi:hypothetical protein
VLKYAADSRLVKLTLFAQNANASALNWSFRGVEQSGASFNDIMIPGINATQQRAIFVGGGNSVGYNVTPVADDPSGESTALSGTAFTGATAAERTRALEALVAAQNPLLRTAADTECVACHTATFLTAQRASSAGVDPATIAGRYTSSYNLTLSTGMAATDGTSLRVFGWHAAAPAISQRVINDSAAVLREIESRFPVQ